MNILRLLLFTSKLQEQKEFYHNVLGLEILDEDDSSITLKTGDSKLTFSESIDETYYHYAFNIPENQIEDAIDWLKRKNIPLIEYDNSPLINFPNWNAHSVYFYDPAGNIVELISRHNLQKRSNGEFSIQSFLNISEIGMPGENGKEFCDMLDKNLYEKLWWGNTETFAAVGNEEGLFIVVTKARNWFPTDKPCNVFPIALEIECKDYKKAELKFSKYTIISDG